MLQLGKYVNLHNRNSVVWVFTPNSFVLKIIYICELRDVAHTSAACRLEREHYHILCTWYMKAASFKNICQYIHIESYLPSIETSFHQGGSILIPDSIANFLYGVWSVRLPRRRSAVLWGTTGRTSIRPIGDRQQTKRGTYKSRYTKYSYYITRVRKYLTSFWSPTGSRRELKTKSSRHLECLCVTRLLCVSRNRRQSKILTHINSRCTKIITLTINRRVPSLQMKRSKIFGQLGARSCLQHARTHNI